jgi:hypothetical protein
VQSLPTCGQQLFASACISPKKAADNTPDTHLGQSLSPAFKQHLNNGLHEFTHCSKQAQLKNV